MSVKTINNITNNFYSDEWYTSEATAKLAIEKLKIGRGKIILCPFDSEKSEFVKQLQKENTVLFGMRDFLETNYKCDYIITNPPFSIKNEVIEKCIEYSVPTLLILPLDSLGGVKRHDLYNKSKISVYVPTRRIGYFNEENKLKKGASFHSIFLMLNTTEKNKIEFEFEKID